MSALLLGEERFSTAIGGGDKLRQSYWVRSEASALLLGGGEKLRHCYLGEEQRCFKKQNQNKQHMLNW